MAKDHNYSIEVYLYQCLSKFLNVIASVLKYRIYLYNRKIYIVYKSRINICIHAESLYFLKNRRVCRIVNRSFLEEITEKDEEDAVVDLGDFRSGYCDFCKNIFYISFSQIGDFVKDIESIEFDLYSDSVEYKLITAIIDLSFKGNNIIQILL